VLKVALSTITLILFVLWSVLRRKQQPEIRNRYAMRQTEEIG